jgi:hypothetical protein
MDPRAIYEIWAPPEGPWSPWAKPVLFAHLSGSQSLPMVEIPEVRWELQPPKPEGAALILDLPGLESIALGLDLLPLGFRPVPLFNACPAPEFLGERAKEVVSATPLLSVILQGADRLQSAGLLSDAPPAFLLDANRFGTDQPVGPGWFDNRWVTFPTDFPSANFLARRGIVGVQVVHRGPLHEDLVDVLRQWQREGISLSHIDLQSSSPPATLALRWSWWAGLARIARRLWVLLSLRRNPQGGYGGLVMESTWAGG